MKAQSKKNLPKNTCSKAPKFLHSKNKIKDKIQLGNRQ